MKLNLQNETFAVGINANPPFTMFSRRTLKLSRGSEAYFIDTLSSYFNFSIRLVDCKLSWGKKYSNGSWDGLIGLLIDKKVDIGIGGTFVDYDRSKAVSFLYPQTTTSITFVTAAPYRILSSQHLIFQPFPTFVWLSFLTTLFICFVFDLIQRKFNSNKQNLFWISFVQLFHQDSFRKLTVPLNLSCYLIFWNFGSFILTLVYAGCLYSLIAAPSYSKTIDTIFQLFVELKSGDIILTSFNNSKYLDYFRDLFGNVTMDIDRYWKPVQYTFDGFNLVNDSSNSGSSYVYIGQRETLRYGLSDFGEKYLYLPEETDSSLFMEIVGIPVRPGFPYYDVFNRAQRSLFFNGLMHHWTEKCYDKFDYKKIENEIASTYEPKAFTLDQLNIFFMVYNQCIIISTIVFIMEIIIRLTFGLHRIQ